MSQYGARNGPRDSAFILKCRDRVQHTVTTYKGVRRTVKCWGPWVGVNYNYRDAQSALDEAEKRSKVGLSDWGVFHRGKRITHSGVLRNNQS